MWWLGRIRATKEVATHARRRFMPGSGGGLAQKNDQGLRTMNFKMIRGCQGSFGPIVFWVLLCCGRSILVGVAGHVRHSLVAGAHDTVVLACW